MFFCPQLVGVLRGRRRDQLRSKLRSRVLRSRSGERMLSAPSFFGLRFSRRAFATCIRRQNLIQWLAGLEALFHPGTEGELQSRMPMDSLTAEKRKAGPSAARRGRREAGERRTQWRLPSSPPPIDLLPVARQVVSACRRRRSWKVSTVARPSMSRR